jgi:hypothetical protein
MMKFIFLLFLLPLQVFSQDLSGIWVGTITTSDSQMPMELVINQDLTGYSMITFTFKGVENIAVKTTTLVQKDGFITMSDDKLIYNNFTSRSRKVKAFCELSIKIVDSVMVLSGPFHTRTRDLRAGDQDLNTGSISLQKQNILARTKLISKLDTLKLLNTISFSNPKQVTMGNLVVAEIPEKDLAAVKVQDPVSSELEKKKAYSYAPNMITNMKYTNEILKIKSHGVSLSEPPPLSKPLVEPKKNIPAATISPAVVASTPPTKKVDMVSIKPEKTISAETFHTTTSIEIETQKTIVLAPIVSIDQQVIGAASEIALRKTEVIRSIDFKSDSLVLILYDNGIVDGDTVSVVLNGKVIIPKQRLSETAYRKVIKITPDLGDSLQLVMYAENLGTIPPNTGLLILEDGPDRQEIRFEGDLKKSSAVILRRKR